MDTSYIVNLWSEFIKQKAEDYRISYNKTVDLFWKNKKLQKEWKQYKSGFIKDIFIPTRPSLPYARAPITPLSLLPAYQQPVENIVVSPAPKRGRPKGSKNKPKLKPPAPSTAETSSETFNEALERAEMTLEDVNMEQTRPKMGSLARMKALRAAERLREKNEGFEMRMEDYPVGGSGFTPFLTHLSQMRNRIIQGEGLYKVQSVLFDKNKWSSPEKASEWLLSHSYINKGVDDKENTYRFRQINPQYIKKQGYKRFVTKPLGDSGVSLILAYK